MNAEQLDKWIALRAYKSAEVGSCGEATDGEDVVTLADLRALFEGKVLVPIKPSHAMLMAGAAEVERDEEEDSYRAIGQAICVWDAMLAASQERWE